MSVWLGSGGSAIVGSVSLSELDVGSGGTSLPICTSLTIELELVHAAPNEFPSADTFTLGVFAAPFALADAAGFVVLDDDAAMFLLCISHTGAGTSPIACCSATIGWRFQF